MLEEKEITIGEFTYLIKELPLPKAQEVLVKLMNLLGDDIENGLSVSSITKKLRVEDLNFFRERLLGEHCSVKNDSGNWVPLGRAIVDSHFAGHLGRLLHLLARCIMHNFSDFLADLRLDELTGATEAE